jgi:hypothetical protein
MRMRNYYRLAICGLAICAQTSSPTAANLPAQSSLGRGGVNTRPEFNPSPHFIGKELPQPPQRTSAWAPATFSIPTNYLSAITLLFEQGLADPRGCEYREIEVGTGRILSGDGGIGKTRGWVLPGAGNQQYAICWNGLVYPAVSVGDAADWRSDARAAVKKRKSLDMALPERLTVAHDTCLRVKGCLLLRLGEPKLAIEMWAAVQVRNQDGFNPALTEVGQVKLSDADPYLDLASDWAWGLFERAVCAHMRGDDGLALASSHLLSAARPQIEASAEQRGFERQPTGNLPWDIKYPYFLEPLPALLADQERRALRREPVMPMAEIAKITNQTVRISALIDRLDQVAVRQTGQPGGLGMWEWDPVVAALLKEGRSAAEPLLQCLESDSANRLTRSVSFGRDFHRGRFLHPVSEPVVAALHAILGATSFGAWATTTEIAKAGTNANRITATQIRAWQNKFANQTPEQRWYATLLDNSAGKALWMDAAANITKPFQASSREAINWSIMQGEALRTTIGPSVTELMARRIRETTPTNFPSSLDFFYFKDACRFALMLSKWDPTGAVPTLRWQMNVARDFSDSADRWMVSNGEVFIGVLVDLTLARIQGGDTNAISDYATWLQSRKPGQVFVYDDSGPGYHAVEPLKPAARFPDSPAIVAALDNLLMNPNSPWYPSLAGSNGKIGLARELVSSPLLGHAVVRSYFLTGLGEKAHAAATAYKNLPFSTNETQADSKFDVSRNSSENVKRTDSLPGDTASEYPFRVCDLFAQEFSYVDGAPPFALYWPLKERDAAIAATVKFIQEKGAELTTLVEKKRKHEPWGD